MRPFPRMYVLRFEIDDVLYQAILPARKRSRYEAGEVHQRDVVRETAGWSSICWRYAWLLGLVNLAHRCLDFYVLLQQTIFAFGTYPVLFLAWLAVWRAATFGASAVHLRLRASMPAMAVDISSQPLTSEHWLFAIKNAISICTALLSAFFIIAVWYDFADTKLGFIWAPSIYSSNSSWGVCSVNFEGCDGDLTYFTSAAEVPNEFWGYRNFYSEWWQLTYARYYI
jgi:hypothetical protein